RVASVAPGARIFGAGTLQFMVVAFRPRPRIPLCRGAFWARAGALSPRGWFALVVGLSFAVWLVAVPWRPRDRPALEREEGGRSLGGRYSTPPSLRASRVALPDLP
ncbi:MAG: hypothetical protein WAL38_15030, partial [Solirubrobacteraceae bacterium]